VHTEPAYRLHSTAQFAQYLRSLRRSRRLTQRQLGERIGVTGARISEIERDPSGVGLAQVLRLLHVLGARVLLDVSGGDLGAEPATVSTRGEW
jgi:HTH-type transcriptional regulator/antitoxin HipB